ncbi:hypothetical protein [uncultured Megamonas sp.]|uniref:hypothetical protein n=1 Tax=uncultured Megamonas sp. TaxID=286140 RepID=UPI0025913A43|nr:hypothetical protein [uncultured Megamonas sp.]
MKKSIKKSSRRKWVVGGVAFFGSIALLTTGFATWVVGVNESKDDGEVTIGVDTVDNKSVIFAVDVDTTDNSIKLAEKEAITGQPIVNTDFLRTEESDADFTFKLNNFYIEIGSDSLNNYNKIKLTIAKYQEGKANNSAGADTTNTRDDEGPWSYLQLVTTEIQFKGAANAAAQGWTRTPSDNLNASTIKYERNTAVDVTLDWGTYFKTENEESPGEFYYSPAKFYNSKYEKVFKGNLSTAITNINAEMTAMNDALNGKQLVITAELVA